MLGRRNANRRPFFNGMPAGGVAASAPGTVIVIGAGAAGLSAARVLHHAGREVIVIEGRDRIGGRLNTIEVGDGVADEGGNWIHGAPANPLYHLAIEAGLNIERDDLLHPRHLLTHDQRSGRRVASARILYALGRVAMLIRRYSNESIDAAHPDATLAQRLDGEISKVRGATNRRYYRALVRTIVDMIAAKESEYLSPNALALNPDDGGADYVIHGGYRTLTTKLADGLDIRLGTPVEAIRYDDDGVTVETSDGTHHGSHVIVTAPIGVLQAGTIDFDPLLPSPKRQAINAVGAGVVEKLIFTFDEPFWRRNPGSPRSVFYVSETLGDFPAFVDTTDSAGCPMLVAFLTGDQLDAMAEMPQRFIDRGCEVLQEIFPDGYRAPSAVHLTQWGTDPFSRCSYSTPTVGVTAEDYEALAEPIAGRVLFAGEATYRRHAGFVEGAMGSGIREARRILGHPADLAI
jgi:monoamine oxidase